MRSMRIGAALLLCAFIPLAAPLGAHAQGGTTGGPTYAAVPNPAGIPAQSLTGAQSHEVVVQPNSASPRGSVVLAPGYGPVVVEPGRSFTHQFGLPQNYNGNRYYYAYPQARSTAPQVVQKETTVVQPRTEHDTYGIGNTYKVDRLYTTRQRETVIPPTTVYEAYPRGAVDRDHPFERPWLTPYSVYRSPGATVTETDKSVSVLNAERANAPGERYTRVVGDDGRTYVVPIDTLRAKYAGTQVVSGPWSAASDTGWTPQPLGGE